MFPGPSPRTSPRWESQKWRCTLQDPSHYRVRRVVVPVPGAYRFQAGPSPGIRDSPTNARLVPAG